MDNCEVQKNCMNCEESTCWYCENYDMYAPIDKRIKTERQKKRKAERTEARKEKKQTDASKRARRAKAKGREGENEVVKLLEKFGIVSERVPLSGALKCEKYADDVQAQIQGDTKMIEVKRRKSGLATVNKWLNQDMHTDYVFFRADGDKDNWIVFMKVNKFIELAKGDNK